MKVNINRTRTEEQFRCPSCSVVSRFDRYHLSMGRQDIEPACLLVVCAACNANSLWKIETVPRAGLSELRLLDPQKSSAPPPANDMPDDVKRDYEEAALVSIHSSKAACAILRLGFQKLCKHLGEPGEHLDTDIRSLAKKDGFPASIVKAADTLRITGNHAVHPGKMSDDDIAEVSDGLFGLLNYIVEQGITKPRELQKLYEMVPEGPRKAAEARDVKQAPQK